MTRVIEPLTRMGARFEAQSGCLPMTIHGGPLAPIDFTPQVPSAQVKSAVLLAGLQAIPQEPYEAALIDGSSRWQTFRHVTLPLLKPSILIVLLLRTMDLLRVFDQIFILTEGGPGFSTETISLYIYRTAFRFFDFGYAAAMSFVLLALTNVISAIYIRLIQSEPS